MRQITYPLVQKSISEASYHHISVCSSFLEDVFFYHQRLPLCEVACPEGCIVLFNPGTFSFKVLFHYYESFKLGKAMQNGSYNRVDDEVWKHVHSHTAPIQNLHPIEGIGGYYFCVRRENDMEERILPGAQYRINNVVDHLKENQLKTTTLAEILLFDLFMQWHDRQTWSGIPNVAVLTSTVVNTNCVVDSTGGQYRDDDDVLDTEEGAVVTNPLSLSFDEVDLRGVCALFRPQDETILKKVRYRKAAV